MIRLLRILLRFLKPLLSLLGRAFDLLRVGSNGHLHLMIVFVGVEQPFGGPGTNIMDVGDGGVRHGLVEGHLLVDGGEGRGATCPSVVAEGVVAVVLLSIACLAISTGGG